MQDGNSSSKDSAPTSWLVGGGEMGKLVRSMDWSKTPLGDIDSWPQSLRTTASLCLASSFPISLVWGPQHVQIYNDGYWPICGAKHPTAMGQDFTECWASAWPVIGAAFESALAGETRYLEDQRIFLDRHGYLEETSFTFSFSPIRDESGGIQGLFHPVTEVTAKMVNNRRMLALREVTACATSAQSMDEALVLSAEAMYRFDLDIPFAIIYVADSDSTTARLVASTGDLPDVIAPPLIELKDGNLCTWPLPEALLSNQLAKIDNLAERFGEFACGPYPEPPNSALVIPITFPGTARPPVFLVAGASPRLPFDDAYRDFYVLLAGAVASTVGSACAFAEEKQRAEALAEIDLAKTTFFSKVSHEFRTPLTLMLGPLEDELAEITDPLPKIRHERLETAHRNSLRLLKLVNTLLDFSRIEAGRIQARFEPIDLSAYTAELASTFRSATDSAGLSLIIDCPPLGDPVFVDPDLWEKIVLNLLSNAFKHTFEGSITVSLTCVAGDVELAVKDTGVGIPKAELPRLFERFHRAKGLDRDPMKVQVLASRWYTSCFTYMAGRYMRRAMRAGAVASLRASRWGGCIFLLIGLHRIRLHRRYRPRQMRTRRRLYDGLRHEPSPHPSYRNRSN